MAHQPGVGPRRFGSPFFMALGASMVAIGILVGRSIAYQQSLGGLGGIFGAASWGAALIGGSALVVVAALIVTWRRRGNVRRTAGSSLLLGALLAAGTIGGSATAATTGGVYVRPIELDALGRTNAEVTGQGVLFAPTADGDAECRSVPDGTNAAIVIALDVGELGSGTLRSWISLPTGDGDAEGIELIIDGADLAEGSGQPNWHGTATFKGLGADGTTGTVVFESLPLQLDGGKEPGAGPAPVDWPVALSGRISWTCGPWGPQE